MQAQGMPFQPRKRFRKLQQVRNLAAVVDEPWAQRIVAESPYKASPRVKEPEPAAEPETASEPEPALEAHSVDQQQQQDTDAAEAAEPILEPIREPVSLDGKSVVAESGRKLGRRLGDDEYTDDKADLILSGLAEGKSLNQICKSKRLPFRSTIYGWFTDHPVFYSKYKKIRESMAEFGIQDDVPQYENEALTEVRGLSPDDKRANALATLHRQRIIDRQWIAERMLRSTYGKIDTSIQVNTAVGVKLDLGDTA